MGVIVRILDKYLKLRYIKSALVGLFLVSLIFTSFSLFLSTKEASASIAKQFNYQGKLKNADGTLVSDGSYSFKFRIYDALTNGNCLWSARGTCGTPTEKSISTTSGIFSTMLGESGDNALPDFTFNSYFLEVQIDYGGSYETLSPRKRIGSVPQAMNANSLVGDGKINITGTPTGTGVGAGTAYINPASATVGYTLFGVAVNDTQKMLLDAEGDVVFAGGIQGSSLDLTTGTITSGAINGQTISSSANFTGTVTTAGTINISPDTDATATAIRTGDAITGATITNGGSGYTKEPNVFFKGGGGSGAAARAVLTGGVVTSIIVDAGGSGYTSDPTVYIEGGKGFSYNGDLIVDIAKIAGNVKIYVPLADTIDVTPNVHNTAFGSGAFRDNTSGYYNTAVGTDALMGNTTGYYNTAFGACSGDHIQGGYSNTSMGMGSLSLNISGNENSAFGDNSLLNTTGSGNAALGYQAGKVNTSGAYNTFLGYKAGTTGTTATLQKAVAIGYNAQVTQDNSIALGGTGVDAVKVGIGLTAPTESLDVVGNITIDSASSYKVNGQTLLKTSGTDDLAGTSDYSNILLGVNNGTNLTPTAGWLGIGNTAVGRNTLTGVTTGAWNVALGLASLKNANTTASNNVSVGMNSGGSLIGNQNVFLGDNSGVQITGSGNVMLGYQAGKQASQTALSNKLYIDNSSTATPLIYGDFATNQLTFNGSITVTAAAQFNGALTVTGAATFNGHILTGNASGSTTIAAGANVGASPTLTITGNDTSGTFSVTTGTGSGIGALAVITFANAYGTTPRVVITPTNANAAILQSYVTSGTTTFTLNTGSAPTDATAYTYNYMIMQ